MIKKETGRSNITDLISGIFLSIGLECGLLNLMKSLSTFGRHLDSSFVDAKPRSIHKSSQATLYKYFVVAKND